MSRSCLGKSSEWFLKLGWVNFDFLDQLLQKKDFSMPKIAKQIFLSSKFRFCYAKKGKQLF
jgi:hypothetical protein